MLFYLIVAIVGILLAWPIWFDEKSPEAHPHIGWNILAKSCGNRNSDWIPSSLRGKRVIA
ncbi:hypothetical protein F5Y18DRAFT_413757 [Xylariaceae sp. FL1019]|nr:hypothetical protein F5Y18DRAFT_413757 [Xylariaceae sp. FL1019]